MNPTSVDVMEIIGAESAGQGFGTFMTDLFIAKEPETPDFCITVYDLPGGIPSPVYTEDRTAFRVRVRGSRGGYATAYAKCEEIRNYLKTVHNTDWGSTRYIGIWAAGDIVFTGFDDNDRPAFYADFRTLRTA